MWYARGWTWSGGVVLGCSVIASGCQDAHGADVDGALSNGVIAGPRCAATPTKLIEASQFGPSDPSNGISAALDLAVNATDLFAAVTYSETGAVIRVPIRGGTPELIAPLEGMEQALIVVGESLVLAEAQPVAPGVSTGKVVRIDPGSGEQTVLASGSIALASIFGPNGILVSDGTYVYFATNDGVQRVPLTGGDVQTLTPHTGSLALMGQNLVIADSAAGGIFSVSISGGDATELAVDTAGTLGPIVNCGADVCWARATEVGPSDAGHGSIVRLAAGSAPTTVSDDTLYVVYRLLFDGDNFVVTTMEDTSFGSLTMVAGVGGPAQPMGLGAALAEDDECLYVGDAIYGVYSAAKSYRDGFGPL